MSSVQWRSCHRHQSEGGKISVVSTISMSLVLARRTQVQILDPRLLVDITVHTASFRQALPSSLVRTSKRLSPGIICTPRKMYVCGGSESPPRSPLFQLLPGHANNSLRILRGPSCSCLLYSIGPLIVVSLHLPDSRRCRLTPSSSSDR